MTTDFLSDMKDDDRIRRYLQETLDTLTSESIKLDGFWKGYLGVGEDRLPILKDLGEGVYCGVRLGGMGVAIGSYLGKELADLMSN